MLDAVQIIGSLLTVDQAAMALTVSPKTIRQWLWQRKIDSVRVGGAVRIPRVAVETILERGARPALEER